MKRWNSPSGLPARAAVAMVLLSMTLVVVAPWASAQPSSGSTSNIEIVQTPSGATGPCLPPALGLRRQVVNTPETFRLLITVIAPLCSRVNAVAAIYAMPGNGVAWPQTLVETRPFTLREPGVTEVVFTKTCDPVQFDVITGATPPTIAPWGPWHGPLLFPFDTSTSLQHFGCPPTPPTTTTTTTTTTSTTTTIADPCDDYTPSALVVSPASSAAGTSVTVSGSGTPGTMVQVLLRSPVGTLGEPFAALSDPVLVQPDGSWSTTVLIPADAAPGTWIVAAQALGCDDEVTAEIDVTEVGSSAATPTAPPEIAGMDLEVTPAVAGAQISQGVQGAQAAAGNGAGVAGLALTGSSAHMLILLAMVSFGVGSGLLLSNRRRD